MDYVFAALIGYLFGSFPTAYLIVKKWGNLDILKSGSGNVGAMNSMRVTNSKLIGFFVLIIDYSKGIAAIVIVKSLMVNTFEILATASLFVVLGHCYSVWIKFKGGRGLAAAAGSFTLLSPLSLLIWIFLWIIGYLFKKNFHFSNITASILLVILSLTSAELLNKYCLISADNYNTFWIYSLLILTLILIKHIEIIKAYFLLKKETN